MASGPTRTRKSNSDVIRQRAFFWDTVPAMAVLVVLQASLLLLDPRAGASGGNVVWALLPLAPAMWLVVAQWRSLRRADECQRVLQLTAMAFGFAAVILLSLLGGLLVGAGIGSPAQSLQVTFIAGILTWIGALGILTWRAG